MWTRVRLATHRRQLALGNSEGVAVDFSLKPRRGDDEPFIVGREAEAGSCVGEETVNRSDVSQRDVSKSIRSQQCSVTAWKKSVLSCATIATNITPTSHLPYHHIH